jgi:hypothetical protein
MPVPDSADIVAEMYLTRWLYPAEDPLHLSSKRTEISFSAIFIVFNVHQTKGQIK